MFLGTTREQFNGLFNSNLILSRVMSHNSWAFATFCWREFLAYLPCILTWTDWYLYCIYCIFLNAESIVKPSSLSFHFKATEAFHINKGNMLFKVFTKCVSGRCGAHIHSAPFNLYINVMNKTYTGMGEWSLLCFMETTGDHPELTIIPIPSYIPYNKAWWLLHNALVMYFFIK